MQPISRHGYETVRRQLKQFESELKTATHFNSFDPGESTLPFLVFEDEEWPSELVES